jgi:hypothetical protein
MPLRHPRRRGEGIVDAETEADTGSESTVVGVTGGIEAVERRRGRRKGEGRKVRAKVRGRATERAKGWGGREEVDMEGRARREDGQMGMVQKEWSLQNEKRERKDGERTHMLTPARRLVNA